jgi:hypothetical protein
MRKLMLLLAVFGLVGLAWAADPIMGTWKTNVSKTKLAPVGDWTKEATLTFREVGDQFTYETKGTLINGSSFSNKGNRPLVGGICQPPNADGTVSYVTVIGPGDAYVTTLRNGKQVDWDHYVVSKDGKTLTIATKGTDANGKPAEALYVLDKQ